MTYLSENILNNSLEFLRRVDMKGLEAFAFVEAYTALQKEHAVAKNPQLAAMFAAQEAQTHGLMPTPATMTLQTPDGPVTIQANSGDLQVKPGDAPAQAAAQAPVQAPVSGPGVTEPVVADNSFPTAVHAPHVFKDSPVAETGPKAAVAS